MVIGYLQDSRPLFVTEERRAEVMSELTKHLIVAILKFLEDQRQNGGLSEDATESLEVAGQCLESAYGVDLLESSTLAKYPLPDDLLGIFQAGLDAKKRTKRGPPASVADKEAADKLKVEGNNFMKQEKITEAVECYSRAIELDNNNAVYYCNRAAAYNKLNNFHQAVSDCDTAIDIDPKYSKAFNRRGLAQMALHQYKEAKSSFAQALDLEPQNEGYKASLEQAEHKLQEVLQSGDMGAGLNLGGLDFTSMLSNPALMNMATNMMSIPHIQQMMANVMSNTGGAGAEGGSAIGSLLQAGQQLAQQMQETNPELVEQLRRQMQADGSGPDPKPDGSEGNS
ncbi:hypothetical protein LSH36_673g01049 [Paralvinella palmiformis]|uniref:SGTA homodimerisation domain-containing protein n=1 Tax=Paralvinella palmiformis TaxID=53620 RepID=A0AAD9J3X2_9ANNE|nr:hypothetical protein LSH36_673g01049 [Paralvinella palmiformis]